MERFIHRQNIEHYEKLLQTVTDEAERKRIHIGSHFMTGQDESPRRQTL
jgi:hypothetical protein